MTIDGNFQPLAWWKEHQVKFPIVSFLARQIIEIQGNQIEMERISSVAVILCVLCRRRLGIESPNV